MGEFSRPFSMPVVPRFAEVDQQGVVFHAHYLTWFDEACTGLLDARGVSYPDLRDREYDFQVVHAEVDFAAPVRWRDPVRVTAECTRIGATSFTLAFAVLTGADDRVAVRGHNVYVVVSTRDWGKRPVPEVLRAALAGPGTL